jgi:hypothetical protein
MKLPQLHLRDLFWLMLVCALGMGWWVDHRAMTTPRVRLPVQVVDFGTVTRGQLARREILASNVGRAPVQLAAASCSCGGLRCDVSNEWTSPGDACSVVLDWSPRAHLIPGKYDGHAVLHTNDPDHPTITIRVLGMIE